MDKRTNASFASRVPAAVLTACMLLALLPSAALGAEAGTAITTQAELADMTSSGSYYLADDITLAGQWTPISSFSGTLDGKGHTIRGLDVNITSGNGGLFASLRGTVKNLSVEGTVQTAGDNGSYCGGIAGTSNGTVTGCSFSGRVFNTAGDNHALGGIVGKNRGTLISDCVNYGEITGKSYRDSYGAMYVGGITGSDHGSSTPSITGCANYGTLSAEVPGSDTYWGELYGSDQWETDGAYVGGMAGDTEKNKIDGSNTNSGAVIADNGEPVKLTEVPAAPPVTLPNGAPAPAKDDLADSLPNQIVVSTDGSGRLVGVTWDVEGSGYDPSTSGDYTIGGTVTLPDKITNTGNVDLSTSITVTVTTPAEAPPDTDVSWTVGGGAAVNGTLAQAIEALSSATGGTIRFNKDVAADDDYVLGLSSLSSAVTLNLNGRTVDMGGRTLTLSTGTLTIQGGGKLTGTGTPVQVGFLSDKAKLVLEDSAVECTGSGNAVSLTQGTGFEMGGGSLACAGGAALNITGNSAVSIIGGTVTGSGVNGAIYATGGTLTVGTEVGIPSKTTPAIVNTSGNAAAPAITGHNVNFYGGKLTFGKTCAAPIAVGSGGALTLARSYELVTTVGADNATAVLAPISAVPQAVWGADAEHLAGGGTLLEAFAAAPAYIRLQSNVDLNVGDVGGSNRLVVPEALHTLDLNGCTISYAATIAGGELSQKGREGLLYVGPGADLTLTDGAGGGKLKVTLAGETARAAKPRSYAVYVVGALTVAGGAIEMDASAVTVGEYELDGVVRKCTFEAVAVYANGGEYAQTGGSLSATGNQKEDSNAIRGFGLDAESSPTVALSGGSIFGSHTGVDFRDMSLSGVDAAFTMSGTAEVSSTGIGLYLKVRRAAIDGGAVTGKYAMEIDGKTELTITGGAITGTNVGIWFFSKWVGLTVTGGAITAPWAIAAGDGYFVLGGSPAISGEVRLDGGGDSSVRLQSPLVGALTVRLSNADLGTVVAKSDGAYVPTQADLEKLDCRGDYNRKLWLALEGEGTGAVIKVAPPPANDNTPSVSTCAITATAGVGGKLSPGGTVRVPHGGSKAFTITPNEGYELADVLVDGVSVLNDVALSANEGSYTFKRVTVKHTIEAQFRNIADLPFTDVTEDDWFYDAVLDVHEKGLMEGTGGAFWPLLATDRATVVTVLWRLEGKPSAGESAAFPDVPEDAWFAVAVNWAAKEGIVKGYDSGFFAPDAPITREQLAAVLWRYSGSPALPDREGLNRFGDSTAVSPWAIEAVVWAVDKGILNGRESGGLDPLGTATRAEAAAMVTRYLEKQSAP